MVINMKKFKVTIYSPGKMIQEFQCQGWFQFSKISSLAIFVQSLQISSFYEFSLELSNIVILTSRSKFLRCSWDVAVLNFYWVSCSVSLDTNSSGSWIIQAGWFSFEQWWIERDLILSQKNIYRSFLCDKIEFLSIHHYSKRTSSIYMISGWGK